ncbi:uncharacterized protein OCT59_019048 [Rhizophagus irregularis]|uniref:Guanylate-binding protein n=2 Tax=Rhizophagus irregularis TaxID=588596 RepID=A0A2P4Q8D9_RHIID|nr:guanylate-binding protein [Rhizophagus irregularis DAOM 181602=DAOM 197198]POG73901.1 guanylate-binding protein [Rhizophagus irregularis DAOM 181602=DAOM 197198]UZO26835.1 hypothetical protein OCT59_019048 [Rhizophagus irregularis]CAG8503673.1 3110_t:CDS:2 [Rhizophagus irregularis]|eukprot:XP_025180767.1 guanylate-binding protein [Rhizophagus irregularis DAOM 181602=DAOM 197198]
MTSPSSDHDIKMGNKFGREIEFREGSPIQLLRYSEKTENEKFGQILLNPKALDIIKEINEPLAIISVVGSYRHGKSWFANVLHGHHDGFALDAKVEGCTRGIYMWSPPFKLISKQHDGIDDPSQDENWATKLFILCLVISSTFVYNINGIFGRDDIGKLHLMTDLSKFIQEPENGDFLPRLVILLRDFILESSTCFKDYFLEQMKKINAEATMGIKKFFYDFDVYGLSPPGCKKKMLQHMEEAKTNELDEEFVEEVVNAVESIYSQLPLKYIGSSTMQGISFVKFLENVIERMNSSETLTLLSITSEYESIIQFVAQEAIKESIDRYEKSMSTLRNEEEKLQMHWKEFDKMHLKYKSEINKLFFEKIIGSPAQLSNFVKQLNGEISKSEKRFIEENSKELTTFNKKIAKKSWARHIKIKLDKNDLFRYKEESQEAWKLFESYCNELMIKSPEADEIIALFKNRYMAAVDYNKQLGKINAELTKTIQEEEDKKSQLIICMNEERLRSKIETLKKEREEYERNANNKILELQANIE